MLRTERVPGGWKGLLVVTVVLVVAGVVGAQLQMVLLPVFALVGVFPCGFLSGYLWWQYALDGDQTGGALAWFRPQPLSAFTSTAMGGGFHLSFRERHAWKLELGCTGLTIAMGIWGAYSQMGVGTSIAVVGAGWLSFLSGLTYRQHKWRKEMLTTEQVPEDWGELVPGTVGLTPRELRQELAMVGSLALFTPAVAIFKLATGSRWEAVLLFLCGEGIAFRAGHVLYEAVRVADRDSRFFRVARLLVHRDERPPLGPRE